MRELCVYFLRCGRRYYIGATVDVQRRIRQHNQEIKGGARKTSRSGPWIIDTTVVGFREWKECLQFEWALKREMRRHGPSRMTITQLMNKERWTKNSPPSIDVPLVMHIHTTLQKKMD